MTQLLSSARLSARSESCPREPNDEEGAAPRHRAQRRFAVVAANGVVHHIGALPTGQLSDACLEILVKRAAGIGSSARAVRFYVDPDRPSKEVTDARLPGWRDRHLTRGP